MKKKSSYNKIRSNRGGVKADHLRPKPTASKVRISSPQGTVRGRIEIWFFIGALIGVYGLLILGTGILHLFRPPAKEMALAYLHPDIWWGALLSAIGLVYTIRFWPKRL